MPLRLDPIVEIGKETKFRYEYDHCPVNFIVPEHWSVISAHSMWKQGKLLRAGGIEDQPATYIDAMNFLDSLWNQMEREAIMNMPKRR